MKLKQLVIATICWARDETEEELLRRSLKELSGLGIPVYICEGGSKPSFVNEISRLPNFILFQPIEKGLWTQALNSLQHAFSSEATFVLYTEPDKLDFFKTLRQWLNDVNVNEQTGVVLASRSTEAMNSFPAFQRMTEATINNCCAEIIGQPFDYTYGPFILNRKIIPLLESLPKEIGWGWRPYAFNIAVRLGLQVTSSVGDYYCPPDQQADDATERIYRMKQLTQNIDGLVLSTSVPVKLPGS
jgi:hypothetical protein